MTVNWPIELPPCPLELVVTQHCTVSSRFDSNPLTESVISHVEELREMVMFLGGTGAEAAPVGVAELQR